MKIFSFLMAVFVAFSSVNVSAATHSQQAREWKKAVKMSVKSKDGKGQLIASGFPIDNIAFLTAGHFCSSVKEGVEAGVLEEQVRITYLNNNDELVTMEGGEIIKYEFSTTQDLCIIIKPKHGLRPVKLPLDYDVKYGDKVFVAGAPDGFFPVVSDGYVSQPIAEGMPVDILNRKLLISAPAMKGSSGGPVYNVRGEVIGVVVMVDPEYAHVTWAVNLLDIWRFLLGG